jgi:hypothetical protein
MICSKKSISESPLFLFIIKNEFIYLEIKNIEFELKNYKNYKNHFSKIIYYKMQICFFNFIIFPKINEKNS